MNDDPTIDTTLATGAEASLAADLQQRCLTGSVRDGNPRQLRVTVRAADLVARVQVLADLRTRSVSRQWVAGIADRPVMVGSVFHLQFDRAEIDLAPTLAVCERCAMLGEQSFELRFRTVQELDPIALCDG